MTEERLTALAWLGSLQVADATLAADIRRELLAAIGENTVQACKVALCLDRFEPDSATDFLRHLMHYIEGERLAFVADVAEMMTPERTPEIEF